MTKIEDLEDVVVDMDRVKGIEGSAIISRDGLVVVSHLPAKVDKELFSAMSATMLGAAETAMTELGRGIMNQVMVETRESKMLTLGSGPETLLVVLCRGDVNLGMVRLQLQKSVDMIKDILEK